MATQIITPASANKTITYKGKLAGDFIVRGFDANSVPVNIDLSKVKQASLSKITARVVNNGNDLSPKD